MSSCNCNMGDDDGTTPPPTDADKTLGPIIQGSLMGVAIFVTDMILRPQFSASNMMELLLFGLEGVVCDFFYGFIHATRDSSAGYGKNISVRKSIAAGFTIWLTDFFLRPAFIGNVGMEMMKFLLQGIFVLMVFNYGA